MWEIVRGLTSASPDARAANRSIHNASALSGLTAARRVDHERPLRQTSVVEGRCNHSCHPCIWQRNERHRGLINLGKAALAREGFPGGRRS
jgi:hypothetical protein